MKVPLPAPIVASLGALGVGGVLWWVGSPSSARWIWGLATAVVVAPMLRKVWVAMVRREPDVDVIALLAMTGALLAQEQLTAMVVAVMVTGGEALEAMARGSAERRLSALVAGAPRTAHREGGDRLVDIDVDDVRVGDSLVVRPSELVPVDGVLAGPAVMDQAAITGESIPVTLVAGDHVASGATNVGAEARIVATATATDSTYAAIVRLVEQGRAAKAPMVRLADRIAGWFVPLTLLVAGAAGVLSGEVTRALAVLVVATPCPLLLATPIAIVAGMSRAAGRGVIIKEGGDLEALAAARTVCLDKTGTITTGRPQVARITALSSDDPSTSLRLAAALEQLSTHPFGPAILAAAGDDPSLPVPTEVTEMPGLGITGMVDGHLVTVGARALVATGHCTTPAPSEMPAGRSVVEVAIDRRAALRIELQDPLRAETRHTIERLRQSGVDRVVLLSGDESRVAECRGKEAGVDVIRGDLSPTEKVAAIRDETARARTVMVGDGVNDAPALAAATVGVAMGARGATASSESAGVVITVDAFDRVADVRDIAVRSLRIARQSAISGMALSGVAMVLAAVGLLTPIAGAVVQEGIDVAVILNALRALTGKGGRRHVTPDEGLATTVAAEND